MKLCFIFDSHKNKRHSHAGTQIYCLRLMILRPSGCVEIDETLAQNEKKNRAAALYRIVANCGRKREWIIEHRRENDSRSPPTVSWKNWNVIGWCLSVGRGAVSFYMICDWVLSFFKSRRKNVRTKRKWEQEFKAHGISFFSISAIKYKGVADDDKIILWMIFLFYQNFTDFYVGFF